MLLEQQPAILGGGDVQRRAALESQLVPQVLRGASGRRWSASMAEMVQDSLTTLKTPEECQAEQIRAYVDEYAALALEAGRIKDRMDWLKGYFEPMV